MKRPPSARDIGKLISLISRVARHMPETAENVRHAARQPIFPIALILTTLDAAEKKRARKGRSKKR